MLPRNQIHFPVPDFRHVKPVDPASPTHNDIGSVDPENRPVPIDPHETNRSERRLYRSFGFRFYLLGNPGFLQTRSGLNPELFQQLPMVQVDHLLIDVGGIHFRPLRRILCPSLRRHEQQ